MRSFVKNIIILRHHVAFALAHWFSNFHEPWPLIGEYLYIVPLGLCNVTANLHSEGLCSWPPENRSGGRGPRLRNIALAFSLVYFAIELHPYRQYLIQVYKHFSSTWASQSLLLMRMRDIYLGRRVAKIKFGLGENCLHEQIIDFTRSWRFLLNGCRPKFWRGHHACRLPGSSGVANPKNWGANFWF